MAANMILKKARGQTHASRLFAAYIALVLVVSMVGPGLAVSATEGEAELPAAAEPAIEAQAEIEPAPFIEAAPGEVAEPQPEEAARPVEESAPVAEVRLAEPLSASTEADPSTVPAAADLVIAAVVPGTNNNMSLTFQGVRKGFGWTTGNLHTWFEGEWVPYRLIIENRSKVDSVSVPVVGVTLDHFNGSAIMYDESRLWGYYLTDTKPARPDAQYPATTALAPVSQDQPILPPVRGTASLIKTSFAAGGIVVPPGEYAVLYFQAHLAVTAEWNLEDPGRNGAGYVPGSSGHGQLDMVGVGTKTVPAPSVPRPVDPDQGDLIVYKFYDANRNGEHDEGEAFLGDWSFALKDSAGAAIATGLTDDDGELSFDELDAGEYSVTETLQSGWSNTTPLTQDVTVVAGETVGLWFGNVETELPPETGDLLIHKFYDANRNGEYDDGEAMLEDWEFTVTLESTPVDVVGVSSAMMIGQDVTDSDGTLAFTGLVPDRYAVRETLQSGWSNTTPLTQSAQVVAGETAELWFGNVETELPPETGDLLIHKFHDANRNGEYDEGEAMLEDWEFTVTREGSGLEEPEVAAVSLIDIGSTDAAGELSYTGLEPGEDYAITETLETGWSNTTPLTQYAQVVAGETAELWFGNVETELPPESADLIVYKFEDLNENQVRDPGESMLQGWDFTLTMVTPPLDTRVAAVASIVRTTNVDGEALFDGLVPGEYTVTETMKDGWDNTTPITRTLTVSAGQTAEVWFGNIERFLPFTWLDLAITKVADTTSTDPGKLVRYTLTYWNNGNLPAASFTIVDDFDQRYVTVVDAAGGVVADGKITWTLSGPLAYEDGKKTITYTVRINSGMPTGTTNVDNVAVISHPKDDDPGNDKDSARVKVRVGASQEEPFLPFTGGEFGLLIGGALATAATGLLFRRSVAHVND